MPAPKIKNCSHNQQVALLFDFNKVHCMICVLLRVQLESVSLCTQFSGFSIISRFSFNCFGSKLVGMFFEIVPMFVLKDFVRCRTDMRELRHTHILVLICATKRCRTKSFGSNIEIMILNARN